MVDELDLALCYDLHIRRARNAWRDVCGNFVAQIFLLDAEFTCV